MTDCPVHGCITTFVATGRGFRDHVLATHVECACGWVGVSYGGHTGARARLGYDISRCKVVEKYPYGPWRIAKLPIHVRMLFYDLRRL